MAESGVGGWRGDDVTRRHVEAHLGNLGVVWVRCEDAGGLDGEVQHDHHHDHEVVVHQAPLAQQVEHDQDSLAWTAIQYRRIRQLFSCELFPGIVRAQNFFDEQL